MGYPYSNGDVLSHSDMNAVGLHLVTPSSVTGGTLSGATVTVGSAVSSVTVSSVFSANFDNYLLIINGVTGSVSSGDLTMTLSGATTSYYETFYYRTPGGATEGFSDVNNGSFFRLCTLSNGAQNNARVDVLSPFLNVVTQIHGQAYSRNTYNHFGGGRDSASHTGFTISPSSGTITGGTIRVYGYSNG